MKISFDIKTLSFQNLDVKKYKTRYPGLNVDKEFLKMRYWIIDNPRNRPQKYERFITNWLNSAYDKVEKLEPEYVDVHLVREERKLPDCSVCLPNGMVLMLVAIKARQQKDFIIERKYDTFQNRQNMQAKYKGTNVRIYKWAFYCRCQRGQYYRCNNKNNIEIDQKEFNEISIKEKN